MWRCSIKKLFLNISQNPQENIFTGTTFLIKLHDRNLKLYQKQPLKIFFEKSYS